jgi:hypothetical protein
LALFKGYQGYAPFDVDISGYKDVRAMPLFDFAFFSVYEDVRAMPLLILLYSVTKISGLRPFLF